MNAYPVSMSIDLHTGYGARGHLHVFLNPPDEPRVRQGLETVFQGHPIDWGSGKDFYTITGDVTSWMGSLREGTPVTAAQAAVVPQASAPAPAPAASRTTP